MKELSDLERAMNHLAEALVLVHELTNPLALKRDCTSEQLTARDTYSHIHWAIKILSAHPPRETT